MKSTPTGSESMRSQSTTRTPLVLAGVLVIATIGIQLASPTTPWVGAEGDPSHPLMFAARAILLTFLRSLAALLVAMAVYERISEWGRRTILMVGFLALGLALHLAAIGMRTDLEPARRWPSWSPTLADALGLICDLIWPALLGLALIPILGRSHRRRGL